MAKKIEQVAIVNNTFFAGLDDKTEIRIAGIIAGIQDKETSSGTAKRFKGEFGVEHKDTIYQSRYLFLPSHIRDAVIAAVSKIGKWDSAEFLLTAKKTKNDTVNKWDVVFDLAPRVEQPRVLAMLND